MAIALLFDVAGTTADDYDQLHGVLSPENTPPAGMLYHVARPSETGFRVLEVWESQAAVDRFFQETLAPLLDRASVNLRPEVFPVHNVMLP